MANNEYVNKVVFGAVSIIDITPTTAVESDVAQGKVFFKADGSQATGTASGGGGLEYEEGTFTPSTNQQAPTIYFANTHTIAPLFVQIQDSDSSTVPNGSYRGSIISNYYPFLNSIMGSQYGVARTVYTTNTGSTTASNTTISSQSRLDEYVTNERFAPSGSSTTSYWRTGRNYKWIAVWAPTV